MKRSTERSRRELRDHLQDLADISAGAERRKAVQDRGFWSLIGYLLTRFFVKSRNWTKNTFIFLFRAAWAIFLFVLFLPPLIIFWIPWTFFSSCRPRLWLVFTKGNREVRRHERMEFRSGDDDRILQLASAFDWPGRGIESQAPVGTRTRAFFKGRPWEIYELIRECWRTINRQGLQVGGVLSGLVIAFYQAEQMWHDYRSPAVSVVVALRV